MKSLTARQKQVLETIKKYVGEKGYPPSIRELQPILGISSLRGVTIHLDALEKKGWIERERTSRSIRLISDSPSQPVNMIPLLGTISAGLPILAVENVENYIPLPADIAASGDELFALRVRGDSMIGDHIVEGDVIVVRSRNTADHNEIVAAIIGDEATVKRLDKKSAPPRLIPSNPNYKPIELEDDNSRILGKVVGLIRNYF